MVDIDLSEYFFNPRTPSFARVLIHFLTNPTLWLDQSFSSDLIGRGNDHCFTELVHSGWTRTMVTCHSLSSLLLTSPYLYIFVWVSYVHPIKVSVSTWPSIIPKWHFFRWNIWKYTLGHYVQIIYTYLSVHPHQSSNKKPYKIIHNLMFYQL